ncbi:uncharacterized protein BKA55DRAFT_562603 [Fusarium redolens]|uniref:Uncharacterized protein n=1 Tax=Fusarium redolens TaxID=48865 RepID=A0A9P9HLM5_FUSRE|nr:uncharacterized protein BKA55DRAFT_562603 [Fusarium redolens]KAH7259476.1 hypothetical protein BKA55DRAFT_562603 [Fusarium redolens]
MQFLALLTTEKCTLKLPLIQSWQLHTHTHDPNPSMLTLFSYPTGKPVEQTNPELPTAEDLSHSRRRMFSIVIL